MIPQYGANKKEAMVFKKDIGPNTHDTIGERVKANGTIESLKVRFYQGQQQMLQVYPYIEHAGTKAEESLITFAGGGNPYLVGDDDYFVFPIVLPVSNDDYIKVRVFNSDLVQTYTVDVQVTVDYYGGKDRVV